MAYSDRRLVRTIPETDSGVMLLDLRSCICKAEHDQSVTKNHIREFPEPHPNRIRNVGRVRTSRPRKTAKTEFLEILSAREWPGVPRFEPAWGLGAEGETGPEAVKVAAWGGESGRGPARGEGDPGCRRGRRFH